MTNRHRLHQLVDRLPEAVVAEAEHVLEDLVGGEAKLPPALANAPWDDELESEEEQALVKEAYEAITRGEVVKDEDLERELGW